MATLEVKEACLTTEVAKLLKQNRELPKIEKKDKAEIIALNKEFRHVQKALNDARLKLVNLKGL